MLEAWHDLVFEAIARTTGAAATWATALDHEVGNHAMEAEAVVVAALDEVDEVRHRDRGLVGKQIDPDRPLRSGEQGGQVGGCIHFIAPDCERTSLNDFRDFDRMWVHLPRT